MRMKLFCAPIVCLLLAALLGGCSKTESENDLALQLRSDFLAMDGCSGTMDVTADYGQRVYEYTVSFSSTQKDGMTLVITAPEEVAGITATVENGQTFLKFDGAAGNRSPQRRWTISLGRFASVHRRHAIWLYRGDRKRDVGRDRDPPPLLPRARKARRRGAGDRVMV